MQLYVVLTAALFIVLALSITDCGNNVELKVKQKIVFSNSLYIIVFAFFILLFWFLTAFRGSYIGNDTEAYLNYYKSIAHYGVNSNYAIEMGYQYFCLFLSKITPNPYFLLIVCATICYSICGWYIYKHSNNILFSLVFLFCIAFSCFTNTIRQALAMVIVLIAYSKIKDGKKVLPIILILLAASFHTSALICLLWFAHKFIPKKPLTVVWFALIGAVLSGSGILNLLLVTILKEYQNYFTSEYSNSGWLGVSYYLLRAFVFYLFIYIAYKNSIKERNSSLAISNSVLLIFLVSLGFSVNLFARASEYFLLITVVDVPNVFQSGKIRNRNFWMMIMGGIMLAYFVVVLIVRPDWNHLYPYQFNWG